MKAQRPPLSRGKAILTDVWDKMKMPKPALAQISFLASAVAHGTFLAVLMLGGTHFPGGQSSENVKVIERERLERRTVELVTPRTRPEETFAVPKSEVRKPAPTPPPSQCANAWYGGIGVGTEGTRIVQVFRGYPAEAAGVLEGDEIVIPATDGIRGDPGTVLNLRVTRAGEIREFTITRDRICY